MGIIEKDLMSQIIDKTDSVLVIFFILFIVFLVLVCIPMYKLIIKNREAVTSSENDRLDMSLKREALIIEVITKNTEVISGLKALFENDLNPLLNDIENKSVDIIGRINELSSKLDEVCKPTNTTKLFGK